jgi:aryl-phospho-beta-D-glucosidase BglC (GH1 family)
LENSFSDISADTVSANSEKLRRLWTQIANEFKSYDEHVLFGGLNEPAADNQSQTDVLLQYEQVFIDAVRATGGNNATRTLVVQGPSTDIEKTGKWYDVTKLTDSAKGALMVEVHYYTPPQFTGVWENNAPFYFWGSANHVPSGSWAKYNATWGEESELQGYFQQMKTKFADNGYPVLLGEYGANWRAHDNTSVQKKHDASIKLFHEVVCREAINHGLIPFVWDINVANQNGTNGVMTVINRSAKTVFCTPAMEGITEGVKAAVWGGPTTGIERIPFDSSADKKGTQVYNVLGQRVSPDAKGLVIIGGKKYIRR